MRLSQLGDADFCLRKDECVPIRSLQLNKSAFFGGGFLLSSKAAEKLAETMHKADKSKADKSKADKSKADRSKADRAKIKVPLSVAELEAIKKLDERSNGDDARQI